MLSEQQLPLSNEFYKKYFSLGRYFSQVMLQRFLVLVGVSLLTFLFEAMLNAIMFSTKYLAHVSA